LLASQALSEALAMAASGLPCTQLPLHKGRILNNISSVLHTYAHLRGCMHDMPANALLLGSFLMA